MTKKHPELSQEIYRRIYRLGQRNIDPYIIAAALKLSYKTVTSVLERFSLGAENAREAAQNRALRHKHASEDQLSVFVFSKTRYAIIDVGGPLHKNNLDLLLNELNGLSSSILKAVAIRLADVISADNHSINAIIEYVSAFAARGHYLALLDPSAAVENKIADLNLEDKIPVFGTEHAFEDTAFKIGVDTIKKK